MCHSAMIRGCPAHMRGGREQRERGRRQTYHVAIRLASARQAMLTHRVEEKIVGIVPVYEDHTSGNFLTRASASMESPKRRYSPCRSH
jgi:hypothetical protein